MEEMKLPPKPSSSSSRPNSTQATQSSCEPQPQFAPARRIIPPIPNGNRRWRRHARTLLEDISRFPDVRGFDEFVTMPVESFAAAVLAGYGWSEGQALGRKRKVGEVQPSDSEKIGAGRHAGQKGTVVERSGRKIMLQSSEEVQVGDDMVAELGSAAEDKCLKKLKKLEISDRDERKRKEERKRDERRDIDEEAKPRTCDITMDGSGELVQGVDQEMLETAQPKYGGFVLMLYGKHKGVFGSPAERDMEEETGVIRDADSHAPIDVRLDKIAEYAGDPSH